MATQMRVDDEIRIRILEALGKKNSVLPNVRQIQRHTGYHKATIKSSLDFMQKEGLLEGFGPKIDFRKFGHKLEAIELLQVDFSQKKTFDNFLGAAKNDPHVYRLSAVIGSGNWNLIVSHFYEDVESFHKFTQENYYEAIPGIMQLIKDRQIFYVTEPNYKFSSRTEALVDIIKRKRGIE